MVADVQTGSVRDYPAYLHFTPRPDQPERFDEQTGFYESDCTGVVFLLGGNGCIGKEQELYDLGKMQWVPCSEIQEPFMTIGLGPNGPRPQYSTPVYEKGVADLYRVTFRSNPHPLVCTSLHRVLTDKGWSTVGELSRGSLVSRVAQDAFLAADRRQHDGTNCQGMELEGQTVGRPPSESVAADSRVCRVSDGHQQPSCRTSLSEPLVCAESCCYKHDVSSCVRMNSHTTQDYLCHCSTYSGRGDELLLADRENDQCVLPSQGDVLERSCLQHVDDLACIFECSPCYPESCHPSSQNDQNRNGHVLISDSSQVHSKQFCLCNQLYEQPLGLIDAPDTTQLPCYPGISPANLSIRHSDDSIQETSAFDESKTHYIQTPEPYLLSESCDCACLSVCQNQSQFVAYSDLTFDIVENIEFIRTDVFYDITCFPDSNYLTKGGIISHNSGTTTCLIAKICRFVIETPPPRRDTPFWVVAESFSQCMSMYDEKFDQQGHLPPHVIDRDRIQWYKSNNNWPFRVPLKSPAGSPGKNWVLEFKSWRQGRGQMQARSLGGFGFIEQFPWGVFEECLRGCREYNFPGSKLIEYTPVDPDMSLDIEEMLENGKEPDEGKQIGLRYLPKNWEVYHANTLCAAEAGQVDMEWFKEFFGMVPAEMLDTRMKGLFSTFEGVIYKEFNTDIHCMGDEMWPRIRYCQHRRGIDWGAGPENDFVCVWGARNSIGQWFLYDSYVSHDQLSTTIDHLTVVHDQWEWPEDDDHYGTAYADPSSPDNIRIACKMNRYTDGKIDNFNMQRGMNSVLEGIEHIQYLLKPQIPVPVFAPDGSPVLDEDGEQLVKLEPKLFIHRKNCPQLVQQMKTYRWLRGSDPAAKAGLNSASPKRAPLKKNDHCCDALRYMCFSDDFMSNSTISSARSGSGIATSVAGHYLPIGDIRSHHTEHRDRN